MLRSRPSLFRGEALEYYRHSREHKVLPRLLAPPVFLFLWILLGLCAITICTASFTSLPFYLPASGLVLEHPLSPATQTPQETWILLFLPITPLHPLHLQPGAPVLLTLGPAGPHLDGAIAHIDPDVLSPAAAQKRYQLDRPLSQAITGPSLAVVVRPATPLPAQFYANTLVSAQVQVASLSLLSWLFAGPTPSSGGDDHATL